MTYIRNHEAPRTIRSGVLARRDLLRWVVSGVAGAALSRYATARDASAESEEMKSTSGGETAMKLRVAGAQIPVTRNIETNVATISRAIDFAAAEKADVLLTPEGSLSGYWPGFDREATAKALGTIAMKARTAGLALALGTCFFEPQDEQSYNQIRFYEKDGTYLGFHSKILRVALWDEPSKGEMNEYAATPLRTFTLNGITIGGLLCNDLWANPDCTPVPDPHLTQQLSKMGARIIFHAVNGGRDASDFMQVIRWFHESNLRMRAKAGKLWIVTVDNCDPVDLPCAAPSGVIDPSGNWVARTTFTGEQFFAYTIELGSEDASKAG